LEGEIPRAFNPNKPSKSRGLDLGVDLGHPSDNVVVEKLRVGLSIKGLVVEVYR